MGIGVIAFLWVAYRPERESDELGSRFAPVDPVQAASPAPKATAVRRTVARRGLLALGPLLGTVATGAILYGLDVGGGSVPGAVIWIHSGISALALLLVLYKVGDLGMARIGRVLLDSAQIIRQRDDDRDCLHIPAPDSAWRRRRRRLR